jgi:hypothetical protein
MKAVVTITHKHGPGYTLGDVSVRQVKTPHYTEAEITITRRTDGAREEKYRISLNDWLLLCRDVCSALAREEE